MKAKKCDRCGKLYEELEENFIDALIRVCLPLPFSKVVEMKERLENHLDLCPECSNALLQFFKDGRKGNKV